MPRISVVLPAFNAVSTIARAVQSILDQTESDLELIVVDDGSTDGTVAVLNSIQDSRLIVLQQDHRGVASAANEGTGRAAAPFIARMDADDVAHPERLRFQLQYLKEGDFDVVGSQVWIRRPDGSPSPGLLRYERWINQETPSPEQIAAFRFVEFPIVNPTILARRSYFELGYRNNAFPEDYDLLLRAFTCGLKVGKVAQPLLTWHDDPRRLTRTNRRYTAAAFRDCRREHLQTGPLAGVDQVRFWGVGQTGKPWMRWLIEQQIEVVAAIDVNKRKTGKKIHGTAVVSPEDLPAADGVPLLIGVGSEGARTLIEDYIRRRDYRPGVDAWFLA